MDQNRDSRRATVIRCGTAGMTAEKSKITTHFVIPAKAGISDMITLVKLFMCLATLC